MSKYTKSPETAACLFNVNDSQRDRGESGSHTTHMHTPCQSGSHHVMHADAGRLRTRIKPKQIKNNHNTWQPNTRRQHLTWVEQCLNKLRNIRAKPRNTLTHGHSSFWQKRVIIAKRLPNFVLRTDFPTQQRTQFLTAFISIHKIVQWTKQIELSLQQTFRTEKNLLRAAFTKAQRRRVSVKRQIELHKYFRS